MTANGRWTGSPLIAVTLFSLAVAAALYAVHRLAHWPFGTAQLAMVAFLAVITAVLLVWQENALSSAPRGFMTRFMLGLTMKLICALAVVAGLLVLLPRERALPLALTFAALYLLFLFFSTARLSTRSRNAPRP